jgi:peptidoglycan hydrolase-like protein with peptidoglycan-binding domain
MRRASLLFPLFVSILFVGSFHITHALTLPRTLQLGSSGSDVTALQEALTQQGFYTFPTATGYFGSITQEAVKTTSERMVSVWLV